MKFIFKRRDSISKDELVNIIKQEPFCLSEKIKFVYYNTKQLTKPDWDLVGVDENHYPVFILIRTVYYDQLLFEIFDLLQRTMENLNIFTQLFSQNEIDPGLQPRIIIIGPSYTAAFKNIISHCAVVNIELYSFTGLENEEGKGILIEKEENERNINKLNLNKNYIYPSKNLEQLAELTNEELNEFYKE